MDYFSDNFNYLSSDTEGGLGNRQKDTIGGYFSDENPYARQIEQWEANGTNKGMVPASLYQSAWEWEERYQNAQINFRLNDPLVDLKRKKAAGYNPELTGSSGGGLSSTGSGAGSGMQGNSQSTDQDSLNIQRSANVLNAFATSANALNSFASTFQQIASGISTIRKMPSEIRLNASQAGLMDSQADVNESKANLIDEQANEIKTLLAGKKELQDVTNGAMILQQLSSMFESGLINKDSNISPFLQSFGVAEDKIPGFTDVFKQMAGTPRSQGNLASDQLYANESKARKEVFDSEYWFKVLEKTAELSEKQLDGQIMLQSMENNIMRLLSATDYAEQSANAQLGAVEIQNTAIEYAVMQLQGDISAYTQYLFALNDERSKQSKIIADYDERTNNGKNMSSLSDREKLEYQFAKDAIRLIDSYGSADCTAFNHLVHELRRNNYLATTPPNLNGDADILQNVSIYWGQFVQGAYTGTEMVNQILSPILQGAGIAAQAYVGSKFAKNAKGPMTGQTITDYSRTAKGGMIPTHKRTITNTYK